MLSKNEHDPLVPRINIESTYEHKQTGSTVFQTSLNIAKLCMGTGTLALPYAAQQGGLVFNMIGLGVIVVWNYYSADCLLRCLDNLPLPRHNEGIRCDQCSSTHYEATEQIHSESTSSNGPPDGTTTYGVIAWHAFGRPGLIVLDLLMIMLFVGLLTSYLAAMMSFLYGINHSEIFGKWHKILPGIAVAALSCAKDISYLSKFSAVGLIALAFSFGFISCEGLKENGWVDFVDISQINLYPESLSSASSWFGVVVFGYGVVPVIFNIKYSMKKPELIGLSTKIGLGIAFVGYIFLSNGIRIIFSETFVFEGDVLQALPDSNMISSAVRLLMTFVVCVTAPFIVLPCGEIIEGKLNASQYRILIRVALVLICTLLASFVPRFVHIISFVGCFCVSMTGFVLPPLFSIQLKRYDQKGCLNEVYLLLLGIITTAVTSAMTLRNLFT